MNWETYKQLSAKQKEEYNYKFKDNNNNYTFNLCFIQGGLAIAFLLSLTLLMAVVIINHPSFEHLQIYLEQILDSGTFLMNVLLWVFTVWGLILAVTLIWKGYRRYKWKKINKIKIIYPEWVTKIKKFLFCRKT